MPSENLVQEILGAARILFQPGTVIEIRVPKAGREVRAGYFDDLEKMAEAVAALDAMRPPGIYWTLNPVDPGVLSRVGMNHRIRPAGPEDLSSDRDILRRVWLPIDCDPVRPKGISSTDEQHESALALAETMRQVLISEGWPDAIKADSGNGAHLLYAVDLPNDESAKLLIVNVLLSFAGRFSTVKVGVDRSVSNASRIFKAYGTMARKGENTAERPHRISRLLHAPALIVPVARELLERAASSAAPKQKPQAAASGTRRSTSPPKSDFNLRAFLDQHGVGYREPVAHAGGLKYTLEHCPFDPSHGNKDAAVFERSDGYGFKCFHDSCSDRGWKAFRELFEPDAYIGRGAGGRSRTPHPADEFREEEEREEAVDVKTEVDSAIKQGNLDAVLLMIPEIARLPALTVLRIKSAIADKFKRKFRPGDFEKAIREERRRGIAGLPPEDSSLPVIIVNTLAAPAADGHEVVIMTLTAEAHVVTTPALAVNGADDTLTFSNAAFDFIKMRSFGGQWLSNTAEKLNVALSEV